jgi:HEAT repeat protein/TolA-binding protein
MKRITLSIMLMAAVSTVGAQTPPPTPPARPAPAARPTPADRPTPAPRPIEPGFEYHLFSPSELSLFDRDRIRDEARVASQAARETSRMAAEMAREFSRVDMEAMRENSRIATEMAREQSRMSTEWARENSRAVAEMAREAAHLDGFRFTPMPALAPMPTMPAMSAFTPMPSLAPMAHYSDEFRLVRPFFIQGEPADSLYRLAHEVLTRGDWGRAAQMFKDIGTKYPNSQYQNDLPYYEAYARYKIGTTEELRAAVKLLEPRASKLIGVVNTSTAANASSYNRYGSRTRDEDLAGLYVRINSALASRGDANAAAVVSKAAQAGGSCDREEMQIKTEAMSALSQMDPQQALPIIRGVLNKKDECSIELRRRAVFVLGRRGDSEAATLLAAAAKSDPSTDVRVEAIAWLPKVQGEAGVNMLEELLRTEQEDRIQRAVVRTLTSSDNARARSSMRALIDRKDAPVGLRIEAVNAFNSDRATTDDAAYLRNLYGKVDNDRVKEAIINAIGRIGGNENDQWILSLAKNTNEPSQFRASAISRLMRANIPIADLMKLYEASDSYEIRSRIVSNLENRRDTDAADKLIEIMRTTTEKNIKVQALQALSRRKDPRSVQLLDEIINGKKP